MRAKLRCGPATRGCFRLAAVESKAKTAEKETQGRYGLEYVLQALCPLTFSRCYG